MTELYRKMNAANKRHKEILLCNEPNYKKRSAERLLKIIAKKMETTYIGALSQFETNFGKLWGHGKPLSELTDSERKHRDLWDNTRKNILDRGNNQFRAIEKELLEYEISWQRHSLTLPVKMEEENG